MKWEIKQDIRTICCLWVWELWENAKDRQWCHRSLCFRLNCPQRRFQHVGNSTNMQQQRDILEHFAFLQTHTHTHLLSCWWRRCYIRAGINQGLPGTLGMTRWKRPLLSVSSCCHYTEVWLHNHSWVKIILSDQTALVLSRLFSWNIPRVEVKLLLMSPVR